MSYRSFQKLNLPPFQRWLASPYSQVWLGEHGGMKDDLAARARAAVQARMPGIAPSDALPLIASERLIDRSPTDTDATFAEALRTAWTLYPFGGTARGVLAALARLGYPNVAHVQTNGVLTTLDGGGNAVLSDLGNVPPSFFFDVGAQPGPFWSRFGIIFFPPLPTAWTNIVNPPTGATAPTIDEVNRIRRTIQRWQRGAATCMGITALQTGRLWDYPVQTWTTAGASAWNLSTAVTWAP